MGTTKGVLVAGVMLSLLALLGSAQANPDLFDESFDNDHGFSDLEDIADFDTNVRFEHEFDRDFDLDDDDVFAALVLGDHIDLGDIADFDTNVRFEHEFDRDFDLDDDDVFAALVLGSDR